MINNRPVIVRPIIDRLTDEKAWNTNKAIKDTYVLDPPHLIACPWLKRVHHFKQFTVCRLRLASIRNLGGNLNIVRTAHPVGPQLCVVLFLAHMYKIRENVICDCGIESYIALHFALYKYMDHFPKKRFGESAPVSSIISCCVKARWQSPRRELTTTII